MSATAQTPSRPPFVQIPEHSVFLLEKLTRAEISELSAAKRKEEREIQPRGQALKFSGQRDPQSGRILPRQMQLAAMYAMRQQRKTWVEIGRAFGCTHTTAMRRVMEVYPDAIRTVRTKDGK